MMITMIIAITMIRTVATTATAAWRKNFRGCRSVLQDSSCNNLDLSQQDTLDFCIIHNEDNVVIDHHLHYHHPMLPSWSAEALGNKKGTSIMNHHKRRLSLLINQSGTTTAFSIHYDPQSTLNTPLTMPFLALLFTPQRPTAPHRTDRALGLPSETVLRFLEKISR